MNIFLLANKFYKFLYNDIGKLTYSKNLKNFDSEFKKNRK